MAPERDSALPQRDRILNACMGFLAHRKLVIAVFALAVIVCATLLPQVKVNYSMTDFLPSETASVISLKDMEESFEGGVPNTRLYAEGIDLAQARLVASSLEEIEGISSVLWLGTAIDTNLPTSLQDEGTVSSWKTDNGYLYSFVLDTAIGATALDEARATAAELGATRTSFTGNGVITANAQQSTSADVAKIMIVAVLVVILILLLTSRSWFEPVIFLTTIGCAVVMNMGTNVLLSEISFISMICGAILQLAVSMDYAIVLLHTFRRCQKEFPDPHEAMAHAMKRGFSVVLSSAAVTFFGFLSLAVMRYEIGVNMGLVLAKGIIFSFLTVMFLMPCLVLVSLKLIDKLEHRYLMPSFGGFARVCQRIMVPASLVIVLVAIPCYFGESKTDFEYGAKGFAMPGSESIVEREHINEEFGESETWVVMVPEGRWADEQGLIDDLSAIDEVASITSFTTVAGQAIPVEVGPSDTVSQVIANGWSRMVVTLTVEGESAESFALVEDVRATAQEHYGDEYRLVGNTVSVYDLRETVLEDSSRVKLFSMLAIGLVLALMFRSLSIPFVVLLAIECSIWINLAIPYFMGDKMNYIGYLVIDAVQLGAAVDYAIIYTREYFEQRRTLAPTEAARAAIQHSAITILTSASILVCAGFAVYLISTNGIISELGILIARGAALSTLMMFLLLPWLLKTFDGLIRRTSIGLRFAEGKAHV